MTIAVGVLAEDCIVLAADSQETYASVKVRGDKILVLKSERPESRGVVAITGAGDADYLDKFAQEIMRTYLDHRSGSLEGAFERTLERFFKTNVIPFGIHWAAEQAYSIASIIAFQRGKKSELLASGGMALKNAAPYVARGTGETVARTVLRDLWRENLSREVAIRLAAYAVYRAKEQDTNSGKDTEVILIRNGTYKQIPDRTIRQWESVFDRIDRITGLVARRMFGVLQSSSAIGDENLLDIEGLFVHSSVKYGDHPLPIPAPVQPKVIRASRRVRPSSKRGR